MNEIRDDSSDGDEESDLDTEDFSLNSFDTENTISHDIESNNIFNLSRRKRIMIRVTTNMKLVLTELKGKK